MRPNVRYGSVAAILVVALGWLTLGQSRSFALAEVIRAAEQHKVVRYKFHWTAGAKGPEPSEIRGTVFVDLLRPRTRFEAEPEPVPHYTSAIVKMKFGKYAEAEQAIISRVKQLRADGVPNRKIAVALAVEGKLSRNGRIFASMQLSRMCR